MRRTRFAAILCMALAASSAFAAPKILRVLTHSSFAATKELIEAFQKANDVTIQFSAGGDAGETLNKAILSKGSPLADVLYGVDNTFMGRALEADIFEQYDSPALAEIPAELQLDVSHRLLPDAGGPGPPALPGPAFRGESRHLLSRPGLPSRHDFKIRGEGSLYMGVVLERSEKE
ncbi:MAG: extracellular solute-binding protein [Spirochaetia bacterium]|jgi:ABC-type thiamine transport system substrate-binding protein